MKDTLTGHPLNQRAAVLKTWGEMVLSGWGCNGLVVTVPLLEGWQCLHAIYLLLEEWSCLAANTGRVVVSSCHY